MDRAVVSIVSKLGQLAVDELQEIRGVGDKVVHLTDELSTMNAFLRMISEADQSTIDHLMREWEKQVRELAYDAEDCADIYHLRINRSVPLLRYIIKWPKYKLEKLLLQRALAAKVKALLARTTVVSERRVRYGIDRAALPRSPWFAPVSATSTNALHLADNHDDQFVGIKEQADTLAGKIKVEDGDKKLKVFSIVGFGGLGKTTLAVELCRRLDADFQRQAQVSVSQAFDAGKDMKGLLAGVLKQIVKVKEDHEQTNTAVGTSAATPEGNQLKIDKIDEMDVAELSTHLKEQLAGKRYLIVIDDVWSVPAWEAIRMRLPENNYSSRIIVTTRIETVGNASGVSQNHVHHMEPLKQEYSEKLFVKRVFGSVGGSGTCPGELKDFMDMILKKCGGLPLAIVSIASLLASYNSAGSVEMWRRVSESIGSQMESHPTLEGMSRVIGLSYDYLPHHLKACMMYMSIFPEDYVIAKDRLLYRWIAEGLVAEKRGLTLFDVAEEYFNELISRNMIQPDKLLVPRGDFFPARMVEACRLHDMMLEVMVSKSQDANFVSLVGRQYEGLPRGKVRRLSVHGNDHKHKHSSAKNNVQHVRSLTVFQLGGIAKLLGEFKLLRVLDLEDSNALKDKHMRYLCRLYLLRFLRLKGAQIRKIPREISDLEYLETLDIRETDIDDVPPTVTKLRRLECLRVRGWTPPQGLGNMKALREVDWAILKCDVQVAREIGELQQLQILYIGVSDDEEPKEEFLQAFGSSLSKTCALRSLHLAGDFLLHVSSPPPLLRHLFLNGRISRFPDWISSLKHLTEFSAEGTLLDGDQVLDSLCELPNLQSIQLGFLSCTSRELVARSTHKFPALRVLNLHLAAFPGGHLDVVKFEQGSMTKLETLLLEFYYVDKAIVGIDNLENLREVKLKGVKDNPLESAMERNLDNIREVLNMENLREVPLERAVEQKLEKFTKVLEERGELQLRFSVEQNLKDLSEVLLERAVEQSMENSREVLLERVVEQNLKNQEIILKGHENKSVERVLKQLEDMNKERPETNQIKVIVEYW